MRLQKLIAECGLASRRTAEAWIAAGRVRVNGAVARLGDGADLEKDRVEVDGIILRPRVEKVYLMLHKPRGFVTTLSDEKGRKTVADLLADCPARVFPVGRLDCYSEGLLLCTNDGQLANRLTHPSCQVKKVYMLWVSGFYAGAEERLRRRIDLDGRPILAPEVRLCERRGNTARLEITLREGRNRQIRRMCQMAELRVTRLCRVAEGPLRLGDLPKGKWRYLQPEELSLLRGACGARGEQGAMLSRENS